MWLADLSALGLQGAVSSMLSVCVAQDGDVFDAWEYRFDEHGRLARLAAASRRAQFSSLDYTYRDSGGIPARILGIDSIGEGWRAFGCEVSETTAVQTESMTRLAFTIRHLNRVGLGTASFDSAGRIASVRMTYDDPPTEETFLYEYAGECRMPCRMIEISRAVPVWDRTVVHLYGTDTVMEYDTSGVPESSTATYTDRDGVAVIRNTYAYLAFDDEGNWVRRIVMEYYRGMLDATWDEVRVITYSSP